MKRVEKNVVQAFNGIDMNELRKRMKIENIKFFSFYIIDDEELNISAENVIAGTEDEKAINLFSSLPGGLVTDKEALEEIYYFLIGTEDYVREELIRVANTNERFSRQFN